jgi:3-deoxy-7-phosphoheptulonate synthase
MPLSGTQLPLALADATRQDDVERWKYLPTGQQPNWYHPVRRDQVCQALSAADPLVTLAGLERLRQELAAVAQGRAQLIQAGDCAESFAEYTAAHIQAKAESVVALADRLGAPGQVLAIGRIAGQFAKPRSEGFEEVDGRLLPSFRGHLVNGEQSTADARRHDPDRMLRAHRLAAGAATVLDARVRAGGRRVWTSHEALVMDYEVPLVRYDDVQGHWYLGSAHLPWIGERTRDVRGAHVRLFASVANPVACKIGPTATPEQVRELCALLDPEREPGRLTLVARLGHRHITDRLPALVRAVHDAGHPVVWICDPMHGNTVRTPTGVKTRHVDQVAAEAVTFARVMVQLGRHPGGLHLETTPDDVTECVGADVPDAAALAVRYTTLCDPRLNPRQAFEVIDRFRAA